jgi:hypothetical protein
MDTLFIKLANPPRKIYIPGLRENIVTLSGASTKNMVFVPEQHGCISGYPQRTGVDSA